MELIYKERASAAKGFGMKLKPVYDHAVHSRRGRRSYRAIKVPFVTE
mgnify:CR=1 FL=1